MLPCYTLVQGFEPNVNFFPTNKILLNQFILNGNDFKYDGWIFNKYQRNST